jgi:hypothetical protein
MAFGNAPKVDGAMICETPDEALEQVAAHIFRQHAV